MATFNITLSDSIAQFVAEQVASGRYNTPSDYIENLIKQDQRRVDHKALESLLSDTLDGDELPCMTDEWWHEKRSQILKQLRADN